MNDAGRRQAASASRTLLVPLLQSRLPVPRQSSSISMMYRRRFVAIAGGLLAALPSRWAAAGLMPLRRLRLANAHTGEKFDGPFRDDLGPIKEAIAELSLFLRDHHSGET